MMITKTIPMTITIPITNYDDDENPLIGTITLIQKQN